MNNEELNNSVQGTPTNVEPVTPTPTPVEVPPVTSTETINEVPPVVETVPTPVVETPVPETPVPETTPIVETTPVAETTPVTETTPVVEATPATEIVAAENTETVETPEAPIGEVNEVISSTTLENPGEKPKKKPLKKTLIIVGVILVIILILGIVFYVTQFASANKRLTAVSTGIMDKIDVNKLIGTVKNEESGSYKIEGDAKSSINDANTESGSLNINGNYGIKDENMYLDLYIQNFVLNKASLLDAAEAKANFETDKDLLYIDASEVYPSVLTYKNTKVENISNFLTNTLRQKQGNNAVMINTIKQALTNSINNTINSMDTKQSIKKDETVGLSNVVTIELNKQTTEKIVKDFLKSIINSSIPTELAKSTLITEQEVKDYIQKYSDTYEANDITNASIEVYTAMFGKELKAIKYIEKTTNTKCTKEDSVVSFIVEENDYKISVSKPFEENSRYTLKVTTNNGTTTISLKGDKKLIQANKKYDENGKLESCSNYKENTESVDHSIEFKNTSNERGIAFKYSTESLNTCQKDEAECEEQKINLEYNVKFNNVVDATYNESPIKKTATKSINDFAPTDTLLVVTNIMTKYGKLYSIVSGLLGITLPIPTV